MKKLFVPFLVVLLVLSLALCACGKDMPDGDSDSSGQEINQGENDDNNKTDGEFDKLSAISKKDVTKTLEGPNGEIIETRRIDTSFGPEHAKIYLNCAYETLDMLKAKGNITDMFFAETGMAAQDFSIFTVLITTDDPDTEKDPCYMVLFMPSARDELTLLGGFRKSQTENNDIRSKSSAVMYEAGKEIKKKMGMDGEEYVFNPLIFHPERLYGKDFEKVGEDFEKLYGYCTDRYFRVAFANWYDYDEEGKAPLLEKNGYYYQKIMAPGIESKEDLITYLKSVFTDDVAERILTVCDDNLYLENEDGLYYAAVGMGGPEDIENIQPKLITYNEDKTIAYLIIECTRVERDPLDWNIITKRSYQEYLYVYDKIDGVWKCSEFKDIPYGMF